MTKILVESKGERFRDNRIQPAGCRFEIDEKHFNEDTMTRVHEPSTAVPQAEETEKPESGGGGMEPNDQDRSPGEMEPDGGDADPGATTTEDDPVPEPDPDPVPEPAEEPAKQSVKAPAKQKAKAPAKQAKQAAKKPANGRGK